MSDDNVQYTEASEFIANHRNKPSYLMVLKFLAGLVTTNKEKEEKSQQILIIDFGKQ